MKRHDRRRNYIIHISDSFSKMTLLELRQQTPSLFVLPEFLLEMYLTSSHAPEARKTRRMRNRVFILLLSTLRKTGNRTPCVRAHS